MGVVKDNDPLEGIQVCRGVLVLYHDGVAMPCIAVLEEIKACEAADRWRVDLPLIIHRNFVSGAGGMEPVAFFCGVAVPLHSSQERQWIFLSVLLT